MVHLSGFALLLSAIVTYNIGRYITSNVNFLNRYYIPAPVTGGLLCSALLSLVEYQFNLKIQWHFELRDACLLIFFCTVGLNARVRMLICGGKTLLTLFLVLAVFLVLQNSIGLVTALAIGDEPVHGLLAGSISMAGGHGTAISWGAFLESKGYQGATEFGLIAATMGLVMGGLLGGPVAHALIKKHNLNPDEADLDSHSEMESFETCRMTLCMQQVLKIILIISLCIICGKWANARFAGFGLVMPDYLPILMIAIVLINTADTMNIRFNKQCINLFGDICLELFITISLMSLDLAQLMQMALPAFIIVTMQAIFICFFAFWIMYRAAGSDYDSSLITSGFIGLGLGATPVGLANVHTLTERFGPSPKAFLIVPLLGSVFTDTLNALILQVFLGLPVVAG